MKMKEGHFCNQIYQFFRPATHGFEKFLKYIGDYNTFGLWSGGGRRALKRGNSMFLLDSTLF